MTQVAEQGEQIQGGNSKIEVQQLRSLFTKSSSNLYMTKERQSMTLLNNDNTNK